MKALLAGLQKVGGALMLPIAVLPIAGLLLRLGQPDLQGLLAPLHVDSAFVAAAEGLLVVAIPVTLVRGLVRLVQERGATLQAIAGALSLYLMIGLVFASVIGFIAEVWSRPYFTQGPDVSNGDRVYFSFTVLTTNPITDANTRPIIR